MKLQFWRPAALLKKIPTQVLPCDIWKLFKNNYFGEHLWTSASKLYLKRDSNAGVFLWILWIIQEHLFCRGSMTYWFWNTSARTCAFHFVEIFHLVAIFAINEWKLIRLILNRLKYKRINLLILYWCNIIL